MKKNFVRLNFLFFLFGLLYVGCTDHEPQSEEVELVTGNVVVLNSSNYRFSVNVKGLSKDAIKEFGIVYSVQYYDLLKSYSIEPDVDYTRITFTYNSSQSLQTKDVGAPATGYFRMYYRAYAILNNGSTLYGAIKYEQEDKSGNAIMETAGKPKLTKPYDSGVVLLDKGQKPIKNFGVVYSYNTAANQTINPLPTLADKSTQFSYDKVQIPVGGAGTGFRLDNISENNINEIYVRSFVEYTDGTVTYGRYVGHSKK